MFDPPGEVLCGVIVAHWRPHSVQDLLLCLNQVLAKTIQATKKLVSFGIILGYSGAPGQSCSETQPKSVPVLVPGPFPGISHTRSLTIQLPVLRTLLQSSALCVLPALKRTNFSRARGFGTTMNASVNVSSPQSIMHMQVPTHGKGLGEQF